jgi:hypothetical protein
LEVKGSRKQVSLEEFSPFVTKILADFEAKKFHSKGVLVGNGLCDTPPKERLGAEVFSPHVLDAAKRHSVALVNSVQLYWAICELLSGKLTDTQAIREAILAADGYVDLRQFFRGSILVKQSAERTPNQLRAGWTWRKPWVLPQTSLSGKLRVCKKHAEKSGVARAVLGWVLEGYNFNAGCRLLLQQ